MGAVGDHLGPAIEGQAELNVPERLQGVGAATGII